MEKLMMFIALVFILLLFGFLTWYFAHKARHKEKILLIEKGLYTEKDKAKRSMPWLKIGIVVFGLGCGLLFIGLLAKNGLLKGPGSIPIGILSISGALSLIVAHYVQRK
ncbi:DUF6249 domain-containing protein [Sphingobacterium griseoflavum]|uniref:DUF6249 domain-containing protein n=1 Tax=Sphingobacterium griseoflavum TaxID=1474952 RepID=A0ABQ3HT73_9SPHI|nr:DUF6249 domain-containing protein [Sphingobacterium griseoflavum]GHE32216.1 hypothetical protein GCM10017764_14290 [Sphingobacterium griseoflavum]